MFPKSANELYSANRIYKNILSSTLHLRLLENNTFSYKHAYYEKWTPELHLLFIFSFKKEIRIHKHQLFGIAIRSFLDKVTNIQICMIAADSFFLFESIQHIDYAKSFSLLMNLLNNNK